MTSLVGWVPHPGRSLRATKRATLVSTTRAKMVIQKPSLRRLFHAGSGVAAASAATEAGSAPIGGGAATVEAAVAPVSDAATLDANGGGDIPAPAAAIAIAGWPAGAGKNCAIERTKPIDTNATHGA